MSPESQFPLENSHGRDWGSNKGADVQVLCILMLEALSLIGLSPGVSISRELGLGEGEISWSESWKGSG